MTVGERIRELRKSKRWTQLELAIAVYAKGEYRTLVSRAERSGDDIRFDMVLLYAKALEVPVLELIGDHPAGALLVDAPIVERRVQHPRVSVRYATARKEKMQMRVTRGFYRHYKGGIYFVHGVATNASDDEHILFDRAVVYESIEGCAEEPHTMRFRPEPEFDGSVPVPGPGGLMVKRFVRVESWPKAT